MENPFTEKYVTDKQDARLVSQAVGGDRAALEELITRHQAWIYNIALRMVMLPDDAEDVTQEILIKMVTHLSGFRNQSAFRTWLYRMAANYVIDMKRRRAEQFQASFDEYAKIIDDTPDIAIPASKKSSADMKIIVEETRLECTMGMLLCLGREHRLAFVLGAIFNVSDAVGAEIVGISKENFRQRLSRARQRITNFMSAKCGLISPENPCRCSRKTGALVKSGIVNPGNLRFNIAGMRKIKAVARKKSEEIDNLLEQRCIDQHRTSPFYDPPDFVETLRRLLDTSELDGFLKPAN